MPLYECVLIARNDLTQQQVDTVVDNVVALIEGAGGSLRKREYWGLRSLAYRIKKNRKGHYALLGLDASSDSIKEMERQLSLNEDVLRFLTLRVEEIDDAPSPILSRKTDDRGERGGGGFRGAKAPGSGGRFESGRRRGDERDDYRGRPAADQDDAMDIDEGEE